MAIAECEAKALSANSDSPGLAMGLESFATRSWQNDSQSQIL